MISALICDLHKEVRDAGKFKLLCEVLFSMAEDKYKQLAKSMQMIYCILMCEEDIIQQVDYEMIYFILQNKRFFTHYEEKILLKENTVKCIVDILKDKEMKYFDVFKSGLQQLPNSETLLAKIENKLNCNLNASSGTLSPTNYSLVFTSKALHWFRSHLIEKYMSSSFKKNFAGSDKEYNYVFPMLIMKNA